MSTLFVNNLNTATGTTITVPTGRQVIGTDSSTFKQPGMILQTAVAQSDSKITKDSTSWVDTGLFTLQFANNLQTGSKVLCRFHVSMGEVHNNAWGSATYFSVFENTTNMGNATYGMANGNAQMTGDVNYTQYEMNRLTGEALFTPAVNNGTYKLYVKSAVSYTKTIGGCANTGGTVPLGATQLVIQEVAQ